jgi:uncharacterized protein (DUF433 family)
VKRRGEKVKNRIVIDRSVQGGKPVVKGTRVPVEVIVGALAGGMTLKEVCKEYRISETDVRACLNYAAQVLGEDRVVALPRG